MLVLLRQTGRLSASISHVLGLMLKLFRETFNFYQCCLGQDYLGDNGLGRDHLGLNGLARTILVNAVYARTI